MDDIKSNLGCGKTVKIESDIPGEPDTYISLGCNDGFYMLEIYVQH
jgi:hypothetical protein